MRRGSISRLIAVGVLAGAVAGAAAYFVPWLPDQASVEAGRIDFVFWFVTVICIVVFSLVAAIILYSVVKFRVQPDDETDGPPIHGHTGLEIVWTTGPAVLVTAISVVSAIVLGKNDHTKNPMHVRVIAQQFAWSFEYADYKGLTSPTLNLPKGKPVDLVMTSKDVIHSFWVPEFGQKQDAVPGLHPHLMITPNRLGTFDVECTELCGLGHAIMRTSAVVMSPAGFASWVKQRKKALRGPPGQAGLAAFKSYGCGSCHTLKAAGTTATTGPDLDKLPEEARRAGKPLVGFVKESITDPSAYVEHGYPDIMPKSFGQQIPPDQLNSLVQYLIKSSKNAGK